MKKKIHPDIEVLEIVATKLGSLREEVVFVGGATTTLYVDDPAAPSSVATLDIDCIVEISGYNELELLEKRLKALGFRRPIGEERAPMCRYTIGEIIVDVMPTDPKLLGFSNIWYKEGLENRISKTLPSGTTIYLLSPEYFLATKMEALKSRGGNDLRMSHDFEDMILVISGCSKITQALADANKEVKSYLSRNFEMLTTNPTFSEAIETSLYQAGEGSTRAKRVAAQIETLFQLT